MKDDEAFARDRDEFERVLGEEPRRPRRWIVVAAAIAGVAVIGIAVAIAVGGLGSSQVSAAPGGAKESTASTPADDADPTETPSGSAVPPASNVTPTPDPEADEGSTESEPDARETLPPAELTEPVALDGGPLVSVSSIQSVTGEAVLPGEVSGPAVRIAVDVKNTTEKPIELAAAIVTLYTGNDDLQASPVSKPAGKAFPAEVAPGEVARGAFVFELPKNQRDGVRVEVDLSLSEPLIAFEGDIG